jgi:ApaG protein
MEHPEFTCTVVTQYLPEQSDAGQPLYAFSYTITIRNTGNVAAQLVGRRWLITDGTGKTEEVRGLGVVGHQPLIAPGKEFTYTSWTQLATPRGQMRGTYYGMTESAHAFESPIPLFHLAVAQALH